MGEYGRELREVEGEKVLFCTLHGERVVWLDVRGRNMFTCPGCARGAASLTEKHGPLIRWGETFWRDRPLTDKEKAHKPRKRSI